MLQQRHVLRRCDIERRLIELGADRVGVKGRQGRQQGALALRDDDLPGGHRAAVTHRLDDDLHRQAGIAGLDEVPVQGMWQMLADGRRGRVHGLRHQLAAEDAAEAIAFVGRPKSIVAQRLQLQSTLECVERVKDGLLQRGARTPQRTRQIDNRSGLIGGHHTGSCRILAPRVPETSESVPMTQVSAYPVARLDVWGQLPGGRGRGLA